MRISSYRSFKKQSVKSFIWQGVILAVVLAVIGGGLYAFMRQTEPAHAADTPMTFSLFATHPYASKAGYDNSSTNYYTGAQLCPASSGKTFCPTGQTLIDMNITEDGQLVAGYGDWDSNVDSFGVEVGRVGVMPLNLSDGTWGDMFYAGSEALSVVRKINGKLYVPTTDPSDKAATSNPSGNISGYITNESGDWEFVSDGDTQLTHTFDVATRTGTDRYVSGSVGGQATAVHSSDGGAVWNIAQQSPGSGISGRYYWVAGINDKVYVKPGISFVGGSSMARSFDGTDWVDEPGLTCTTNVSKLVITFDERVVCDNTGGTLKVFDGASTTNVTFTSIADSSTRISDFYVDNDNGYLYLMTTDRRIYRTSSLEGGSSWEQVNAMAPEGASSLAVHDGFVYVGANNGRILKSDEVVSSDTIIDGGASCFGTQVTSGSLTITAYYNNQGNNPSNPTCPKDVTIPGSIEGLAVTRIDNGAFQSKQLTSVILPDTVTHINTYAFARNQLTAVMIPSSVTSLNTNAFYGNPLTKLSINASVALPSNAFRATTGSRYQIEELTIGSSVTGISTTAFRDNPIKRLSIDIPVIPTDAFKSAYGSEKIEELTLGSSVVTIGNNAFQGQGLTEVTIPDSVTTIGDLAFGSNELASVVLGSSLTHIGRGAFYSNQLTTIDIPDSVTTINTWAFSYNSLASATLGESVEYIGVDSFDHNQLTSVVIPASVTTVDARAFKANPLSTVYLKGQATLGEDAFNNVNVYDGVAFIDCVLTLDPPPADLSEYAPCYEAFGPENSTSSFVKIYADYPQHYSDKLYYETAYAELLGFEPAVLAGYIINPAQVTARYVSTSGEQVHTPATSVGVGVQDYSLRSLFTQYPGATEEDLNDIYYRQDQSVTFSPLEITGYQTPSPQTITLASSDNEVSFVYRSMSGDGGNDGSGDSSNESDDGESVGAPNTGIGMMLKSKVGVAIGLIILALAVTGTLLYRKRAQRH